MRTIHTWNPDIYDKELDFVSEYGKEVISLLNPIEGERILDLGSGTGDLTYEIAKVGAKVVGMDLSIEMIEKAQGKYPNLEFVLGNAEDFAFDQPFDAVFSNDAIHWMPGAKQVAKGIWKALRPGGRFVTEFGGIGNIETVVLSITEVLSKEYKVESPNPWYFPSIGEYSSLLEQQGFHVTYAVHFNRPTKLKEGNKGLYVWLNAIANDFFRGFTAEEKRIIYDKIASKIKKQLFRDGSWYIDYKRIRIVAVKP